MKKLSFFLITIIIWLVTLSCGFKNKLINNAISVTIRPGNIISIQFNSQQEFNVSVRDPRGKLMDVDATWSISGFSPDVYISTNSGRNIIFYTGNTEAKGVLTAEYDGVRQFVNIEVKNENSLILYKNGELLNKIDENNLLYGNGVNNNPDDCITINEVLDDGGEKCFELTVKRPNLGNPVGFYFEFKNHEDLSKFTTLHFSMRSCDGNGSINFSIYAINETDDGDEYSYKVIIPSPGHPAVPSVGGIFSNVPIDISAVSRDTTKEIIAIEFTNSDIDLSPRKVRLKDIYLD